LANTGPAWCGSAIWFGRFKPFPFQLKATPEPLALSNFAGAITERPNVVEDSVEAYIKLIDAAVGKDVGLGYRHIAPVIQDVLRAGEGVCFGKSRGTTGYEGGSLIVAEASES